MDEPVVVETPRLFRLADLSARVKGGDFMPLRLVEVYVMVTGEALAYDQASPMREPLLTEAQLELLVKVSEVASAPGNPWPLSDIVKAHLGLPVYQPWVRPQKRWCGTPILEGLTKLQVHLDERLSALEVLVAAQQGGRVAAEAELPGSRRGKSKKRKARAGSALSGEVLETDGRKPGKARKKKG